LAPPANREENTLRARSTLSKVANKPLVVSNFTNEEQTWNEENWVKVSRFLRRDSAAWG